MNYHNGELNLVSDLNFLKSEPEPRASSYLYYNIYIIYGLSS